MGWKQGCHLLLLRRLPRINFYPFWALIYTSTYNESLKILRVLGGRRANENARIIPSWYNWLTLQAENCDANIKTRSMYQLHQLPINPSRLSPDPKYLWLDT